MFALFIYFDLLGIERILIIGYSFSRLFNKCDWRILRLSWKGNDGKVIVFV